jgi:hypothetical protein
MPTKTRKFRQADVDGTVPGVAMLVSADLSQGENASPQHTVWVEAPGDRADPVAMVQGLWESIKSDWPGHSTGLLLNERARYLMAQRRMREMFGEDSVMSPREYWEENA